MGERFKRLFLSIEVDDRVMTVKEGMFPFKRKTVIPLSRVTAVDVSKLTKQLVITTADGKERRYSIGGFGKAQACRDAIAGRL